MAQLGHAEETAAAQMQKGGGVAWHWFCHCRGPVSKRRIICLLENSRHCGVKRAASFNQNRRAAEAGPVFAHARIVISVRGESWRDTKYKDPARLADILISLRQAVPVPTSKSVPWLHCHINPTRFLH